MAGYYATIKEQRDQWIREMLEKHGNLCWITKRTTTPFRPDCHEIIRRSRAPGQWGIPANYLLVGRAAHDEIIPAMSEVAQLAHKLYYDADHFDLDEINRIKGGEPIKLSAVVRHMVRFVV